MHREKQQVFTYLYLEEVSSDNKASQRAIRRAKMNQKKQAAQIFVRTPSIIDTSIKNGLNVLEALVRIAKFDL